MDAYERSAEATKTKTHPSDQMRTPYTNSYMKEAYIHTYIQTDRHTPKSTSTMTWNLYDQLNTAPNINKFSTTIWFEWF